MLIPWKLPRDPWIKLQRKFDGTSYRLIKEKADDSQFDNCLLTFEELAIVKSTLVKTLVAYGHSRVKYPTQEIKAPPDVHTILDS